MAVSSRLFSVVAALFAAGCPRPATQVLVWADVAAGSALGPRASAVHVEVWDGRGVSVFDETRPFTESELPISVSVLPQNDDATRTFRVAISLLEGAEPYTVSSTVVAESAFLPDTLGEIHLVFEDACASVVCGEGRTCIAGVCERACFAPSAPGTTTPSVPTSCPCECECAGDVCRDGLCVPARPVRSVAAGHEHACAIDAMGALFCWGRGAEGELGQGALTSTTAPTATLLSMPALAVATGARHTCAVTADGSVHCWGDGTHGAVGPGAGGPTAMPARVVDAGGAPLADVVGIGAGGIAVGTPENHHSCAVRRSGEVLCWGSNDFGQLGVGSVSMTAAGEPPRPLVPSAIWDLLQDVELGGYHTCARHAAGRLFCWGNNHDWQIGFEDQVDRAEPASLTEGMTELSSIADLAAGTWHSCAVTPTGELFCWGEGSEFRSGLARDPFDTDVRMPTRVMPERSFARVECGHRHSCAIEENGHLWCFGTSGSGELGVLAVSDEAASLPVELADEAWTEVSLGTSFTCGIREGGALYCWGRNDEGQLGIGSTERRLTPSRVCLP